MIRNRMNDKFVKAVIAKITDYTSACTLLGIVYHLSRLQREYSSPIFWLDHSVLNKVLFYKQSIKKKNDETKNGSKFHEA